MSLGWKGRNRSSLSAVLCCYDVGSVSTSIAAASAGRISLVLSLSALVRLLPMAWLEVLGLINPNTWKYEWPASFSLANQVIDLSTFQLQTLLVANDCSCNLQWVFLTTCELCALGVVQKGTCVPVPPSPVPICMMYMLRPMQFGPASLWHQHISAFWFLQATHVFD